MLRLYAKTNFPLDKTGAWVEAVPAAIIFSFVWVNAGLLVFANVYMTVVLAGPGTRWSIENLFW